MMACAAVSGIGREFTGRDGGAAALDGWMNAAASLVSVAIAAKQTARSVFMVGIAIMIMGEGDE